MTDSLKVLNIEDSEDDAHLIQRELRRAGFNIIWERVETAEALYAALERQTWDVIISDYNLPKFNATDALQIVKGRYPNLPFIVVSGTIGETAAVELMRAGAQDYLMKGSLARLSEAVRREVRDAENRVEHQRSQLELDLVKESLQLAVEGSGIGLWDWAIQTDEVIINERLAKVFGYSLAELEQFGTQTWWQLNHPEDSQKAKLAIESHFQQKTLVYECELRKRHKSGEWVWVLSRGKVVEWDADGKPLRMTGTILDISDRKQTELRVQMQNSILKLITKGEPLPDILDAIVRAMEDQIEGAICSILLCDRQGKLRYGASPNLPTDYNKLIEGMTISEGVGSCGTAAFRKQPVIVSDIATDPLWQDYKELVLAYNLRSCWSFPAIASDGSVLATLAVYHHDVHSPQQPELDVIALAADIVKIAIEREQATQALEQLNHELEGRVERRTKALRQSEARLHEAQQIAHLGSWEIDLLSQKLNWSAEVFKIFGLDPNQPEPTYAEMLQYYPLDERKRVNDFVDKAMQGQPYETDFQIIRADGSSGYTFAKTEPIWDGAGQVIGLFGIVMDISDRKATQEALKRSEERALATLLALPDLVFRVNRDGQYMDFLSSPQGKNLVDPNASLGKSMYEALPADIVPNHVEAKYTALQQALATQTVQAYEQEVRIEGTLRYEEVRVAPCGNDEVVFFVRDISDRKQSEEALAESEAFNRQLIEEFPIGLASCRMDGQFVFVNSAFAKILGRTIEETLELTYWDITPIKYAEQEAAQLESLQIEGRYGLYEKEYIHKDGHLIPVLLNGLAIVQKGELIIWSSVQDISDRKQSEAKLQLANEELMRATRLKDEFLANMSHELRTPLNSILGMNEALQEGIFGSINERQLKALQTIESSSTHLLALINDILDVAKIASGHIELDYAPTAIHHLCQSSLTFIKQPANHKRIQIHTKFQPNLPDLLVDERRIRQVLINLLSNAVKFTAEGGSITLEVSRHQSLTNLERSAEGSNDGNNINAGESLEIAVIDTGIGIASADLQRLFQPFVQIDSALNRQYNGTGLGLALVKQIVELHGGQVGLTSELGVGSRFSIKLPYVPNIPLPLETIASNNQDKSLLLESPNPSEIKSPLILIAEDNEANIMTISSYLVAKGYRIEEAHNGQEAIDLAKALTPDIILMDIQMPIMDGLEAIKQIRLDRNLVNIPIIALTALAMEGDREKCLEVGANDYIAKPVRLRNLSNTIQELLRSLK